ncbi:Glycosyltransferase WbsX [Lachnospiraceae bacterium C10]|nr:Glycosyltransferase WbsX [Lachnospiraceae bacterium C10]
MKAIALYLPQFHEIEENNKWWGEGFTEWTNVKNAKPLFSGHEQPKVPMNDNYYCLLDDRVKEWQIKLAKENGVYGFCFYHYWFNGHLLLEKPVEQFLNNSKLDFPFCLCWANQNWTKIWSGNGNEVLISHDYYEKGDLEKHFQYFLRFFRDERYIKEDGKPVLVIYSPDEMPNLNETVDYFRKRIVEEGFPGIVLMYQYIVAEKNELMTRQIFDYKIHFQPVHALHEIENSKKSGMVINLLRLTNDFFFKIFNKSPSDIFLKLRKTSYDEVWEKIIAFDPIDKKDIACAIVNWDNTSRRGKAGRILIGSSPEKFGKYVKDLVSKINRAYGNDYLFITAWNEWSEGAYLEPDKTDGDAYLRALGEALLSNEQK